MPDLNTNNWKEESTLRDLIGWLRNAVGLHTAYARCSGRQWVVNVVELDAYLQQGPACSPDSDAIDYRL